MAYKLTESRKLYLKSPKRKLYEYKKNAKTRSISFDLSFEDFMIFWQKPCTYCGSNIETVGIDRKDSSIGYNVSNCTPCCFKCNEMKNNKTTEDFIEHIKKIINHLNIDPK